MRYKIITSMIILSLLCSSCTEDKFIEAEPQMVVEGWIDDGGYPIVMLSQIIPVSNKEIQIDDLKDYVITLGKVTISDGENEIVLTGKKNNNYFPPYIYTTNKMRGEAGKTYHLTAEYKNFYATATTTIPPKVEIEKIIAENNNGKYSISAVINDNPDEKNYYKFFIQIADRDLNYLSSNHAVIDDSNYTFPCSIPIGIGKSSFYYKENSDYDISEKDRILIKFAQIDSVSYNFWNDYKNIVELGQNSFSRYSSSIRSNISGGLGYWAGYGATEYLLAPGNHESPIILKK